MSYNTDLQNNNEMLQSLLGIAQALPTNGINYSAEETPTGGTWIDGKPIYRAIINVPSIDNGSASVTPTGLGAMETIVSLNGYGYTSSNIVRPLPFVNPSDTSFNASLSLKQYNTSPEITIYVNAQGALTKAIVIIEYTKL